MLKNYSDRLRFVRKNLTKLSREAFGRKYGINNNTLKSWELGINPLNEKSANQISEALLKEGYSCSPEWLIFGLGNEPRPLNNTEDQMFIEKINEQARIIYEGEYFKKNNLNSIVCMVTDASMVPHYYPGDYVGGILIDFSNLKKFSGSNCIVTISKDIILIRKILLAKNGFFLLCPSNLQFEADVVKQEDILSIASIIWHRAIITRYQNDN